MLIHSIYFALAALKYYIYTMNRFIPILIILFFLAPITLQSQELFRTTKGHLLISIELSDTSYKMRSNDVLVLLDYSTATIEIKVDESSIKTGIDSIDGKLINRQKKFVTFSGQLDTDNINIKKENIQTYPVEGDLNYKGEEYLISGDAYIKNLHNSDGIQAILTLEFDLNLNQMEIPPPLEGMGAGVNLRIAQSILSKHNQ